MINQSLSFLKILIIITTQLTYASYKSHNVSTNCTTASLECPTQELAPLPVAPCRYRTTTTAGIRNLVTRKRRPERSADLTEWPTVGGKFEFRKNSFCFWRRHLKLNLSHTQNVKWKSIYSVGFVMTLFDEKKMIGNWKGCEM